MSAGNWKDMFKAVQDGDIHLVEYYLKLGVDPNYQHPEFMALPLVESIRYNYLDIAKLLLAYKADPTIKEIMEGETALSVAKRNNNIKAVELLNKYL